VATRKTIGLQGEHEAARHLQQRGYTIIARRERILHGDIDIVALDNRTVVFVEVRSKTNTEHGHPAETIDTRKKQRICTLANAYIKQHRLEDYSFRLDVVTVLFLTSVPVQNRWLFWRSSHSPIIEHFQNAFDSDT
jgi:putative endonuclease